MISDPIIPPSAFGLTPKAIHPVVLTMASNLTVGASTLIVLHKYRTDKAYLRNQSLTLLITETSFNYTFFKIYYFCFIT